jgi:hypothetical protein
VRSLLRSRPATVLWTTELVWAMTAAMAGTRRADMFTDDGKPSDSDQREHRPRLGVVLAGRKDIVRDLARLRRRFLASGDSDADDLLDELELLAATAVALGMSYSIVDKASGLPRERIEVVLEARPTVVERSTSGYQRHASGAISRRET